MTLQSGSGVPPSHSRATSKNLDGTTVSRRRNTVGSPTSAVFKPGAAVPNTQQQPVNPAYYTLLATAEPTTSLQINGVSVPTKPLQRSSRSPSPKGVSPHRRRPHSRSPERVEEQQQVKEASLGCLANGRRSSRPAHLAPKSGVNHNNSSMVAGKRYESAQQTMTQRPPYRTQRSNQSNLSASLPSTPNHLPRANGVSRSPSPPTCLLDSPRSAASEPTTSIPYQRVQAMGCQYETALVNARRRMPYSLGFDKLPREKPRLEKLSWADEEKLSNEMMREFKRLVPTEESKMRRRKFLAKLDRILNDEWPGYDTEVHAFGSTENHLCMNDSDVDVCITTRCKEIEATCKLAAVLAQHGMERVVCVPGAKVPIVKIWDPEFRVACDMNVNNTVALDNTRMIKTYVEIDERVRPLAMIVKYWTKERLLNDAATGGTLSSYTWICMILNFLQTRDPPILPSLHLRPHPQKPPNCGVDVSFDDDIDNLRGWGRANKETVGGLLFAFFKKYGHDLDYDKAVISLRLGTIVTKQDKGWQYMQNNRLCVEEPFNTMRNLGNTADDSSMKGIHMEFRRAHQILSETASLARCCERYEFPPEEPHHLPPPPVSRPVTITHSNPRNRNGFGRGGRSYQSGHRGGFGNRRSSNNAYNHHNFQQQSYYSQEGYGYMSSAQEQLLALQMQIQAQQQLFHAQAQAQYHNPAQKQGHPHGGNTASNTNPNANSVNGSEGVGHFQQYVPWQYIAQLYGGLGIYNNYGIGVGMEGVGASNSPPRTPGLAMDQRRDSSRLGLGRSRRQNGYTSGPRSHSQPPSYPLGTFSQRIPVVGVAGSEDEDFGDHSSNGNPPETPPEEDEYVGYYTIGGTLQSDVAVLDPQIEDDEEPFSEQKTMVDRTKRFSSEKLPPPLLAHQSPHRSPVVGKGPVVVSTPAPVVVNGTTPLHALSQAQSSAPLGTDGASDVQALQWQAATASDRRQVLAQTLLDVHTQNSAPSNPPRVAPVVVSSEPEVDKNTSIPGTAASQSPKSKSISSNADDDSENPSPKVSPLQQRAASKQLLWANSRAASGEPLKNKVSNASQEDLTVTSTSEPKSPARNMHNRKKDESKQPSQRSGNPRGPSKATPSDPTPPTPAHGTEKAEKQSGNNSHHRKGKPNNSRNTTSTQQGAAKSGNEAKHSGTSQWRKTKRKKARPGAGSGNGGAGANKDTKLHQQQQPVKESERKGG